MNNDLANWLRDFANANEDSFESDQIRNLLEAACEILRLHKELEEARNEADDLSRETLDHGGALGQFERENDDA